METDEAVRNLVMFIANYGSLGDDKRYWHEKAHEGLEHIIVELGKLDQLQGREPF